MKTRKEVATEERMEKFGLDILALNKALSDLWREIKKQFFADFGRLMKGLAGVLDPFSRLLPNWSCGVGVLDFLMVLSVLWYVMNIVAFIVMGLK